MNEIQGKVEDFPGEVVPDLNECTFPAFSDPRWQQREHFCAAPAQSAWHLLPQQVCMPLQDLLTQAMSCTELIGTPHE